MLRSTACLSAVAALAALLVGVAGPAWAEEDPNAPRSTAGTATMPAGGAESQPGPRPACIVIAGYCQKAPSCADSSCESPLSVPGQAPVPLPARSPRSGPIDTLEPRSQTQAPPPDCWSVELPDIPVGTAAVWQGHAATEGYIVYQKCREGVQPTIRVPYFVAFPVPGVPAQPDQAPLPPDPAVLAEEAISRLTIPMPEPHFGPDRSTIAVQLWTWLWTDAPAPVTSTVELQGVSVTATATLQSTTWSLGEPAARSDGEGFRPGPSATVTCQGAGAPFDPAADWRAEPPCGHQFRWRSTEERTDGSGKWPIAVTTTWAVVWQASTGQAGTATLTGTAADAVRVAEYRILLTPGG